MKHLNAATTAKAQGKETRARAKASLEDSLSAVQMALSAMPDAAFRKPAVNLAEAFIQADPVLATLHKQLMDARSQNAQLVALFGAGDAMAEAMTLQIAAIEKAYNDRLAALRRRREEATRKTARAFADKLTTEEKKPVDVRHQPLNDLRRYNGTLWSWAVLMLSDRRTFVRQYGLVPNAA